MKSVTNLVLLVCGILLFAATVAQAVPVTVNTGAYQGRWYVGGVNHYNSAMVDLPVGTSNILVGIGSFKVDVAADGTVTVPNGVSAVGGAGSLTFNTTQLAINTAAYSGFWDLDAVSSTRKTGPSSEVVVPGIFYDVRISAGRFRIDVATDGLVTVQNGVSATGGTGTLTFNTTTLAVDPLTYTGIWDLDAFSIQRNGPFNETVVPGITYKVRISSGGFLIDVAGDGLVTVQNGISAVGGTGILAFNNTTVAVDPKDFVGRWYFSKVSSGAKTGPATEILVPGITYAISACGGSFLIDVAGDGFVTVPNGISAVGDLGTLTFKTTPLAVDPAEFTGVWYFSGVSSGGHRGPFTEVVIPGLLNFVVVGPGNFKIDVAADGSVTVQNGASAVGGLGTLTFNTMNLTVDPAAYAGRWYLSGVTASSNVGPFTEIVVPGVTYIAVIGGSYFRFDVAGSGLVSVQNGISGTGGFGILTFANNWITFDPRTYTGTWSINSITDGTNAGIGDVVLVPGMQYQLRIPAASALFDLQQECSLSAPTVTVGTETFTLACSMLPPNQPPFASAGPGQNAYLGETVLLDGSASSDPDGDPLTSYTWTFDAVPAGSQFADPAATLSGVTPTFTPDLIGDYLLSLVVNDGRDNSAAAATLVTVVLNQPPVATATANLLSGEVPLTVVFDASASYDPEGGALTYSWNFADPASAQENLSALVTPSHTFNTAGTYTVMVDVFDDFGNLTQASVDIVVTDVIVPPPLVDDPDSNELGLAVWGIKIDKGEKGKVHGSVSMKAGFNSIPTPAAEDRIVVSLDGVSLLDVPFAEFRAEKLGSEFEYDGRKLKVEIDFTRARIEIKRHKMVLSGLDNSDGIDVRVSIGTLNGFENVRMRGKHQDGHDERELSHKDQHHDD